jgi:hypothetical protein
VLAATMKRPSIITFFLIFKMLVYGQDTTRKDYTVEYRQTESRIERPKFHTYPKQPTTAKTLQSFVPKGWKVLDSVFSDLNGDKIPDLSLVLQYKDTVNERMPGNWEWENTPRILLLLFKEKYNNVYKLRLQNNFIIPRAGTGKQGGDPFQGLVVKNNVLTIGGEMGEEYNFQFLNGDFFLISASSNGRIPAKEQYSPETYNYDTFYYYQINFLKKNVIVRKYLMDGDNSKPMEKQIFLPKQSLLRLRDLKEFDERKIFKGLFK